MMPGRTTTLERTEAAARLVQGVIDFVREGNLVAADRKIGSGTEVLVTGMSFWAYRALSYGWAAVDWDGGGHMDVALQKMERALELTRGLGVDGELCMACVREHGEDAALPAEYQLASGVEWEPVPTCRACEQASLEIWGRTDDAGLEPLGVLWPPWSIAPTWSNRLPEIFSHERFGYAAWQQALLGNVDGMYLVAMCYEVGMGMQRSVDAALHWYKQAEAEGYPGAESGRERCERRGPWERSGATKDDFFIF